MHAASVYGLLSGAANPVRLVSKETQRTETVKAGPTLGALTVSVRCVTLSESLSGFVALRGHHGADGKRFGTMRPVPCNGASRKHLERTSVVLSYGVPSARLAVRGPPLGGGARGRKATPRRARGPD